MQSFNHPLVGPSGWRLTLEPMDSSSHWGKMLRGQSRYLPKPWVYMKMNRRWQKMWRFFVFFFPLGETVRLEAWRHMLRGMEGIIIWVLLNGCKILKIRVEWTSFFYVLIGKHWIWTLKLKKAWLNPSCLDGSKCKHERFGAPTHMFCCENWMINIQGARIHELHWFPK